VPDPETLRAAERRLQAAQLASDVTALDALIDDEALFTGPDGTLMSTQDDLAAHRDGRQSLRRLDELELRVLATGSTGVTWFLGELEAVVDGNPVAARVRYTRTWVHDGSDWRVVAAHATVVG
jgi:ketosteroid isomerase-like protein